MYQDIEARDLKGMMDDGDVIILDVRTPAEKSEGFIPGHQMIDFMAQDFVEKINQLDKSKKYMVYCRSGNRSAEACNKMAELGFKNLFNLKGGIGAWNIMHV